MKASSTLILAFLVVSVSITASPTFGQNAPSVGVKKGDWMEYSVYITGTPPAVHKGVVWMRIEVLQVEGTAFPANLTLRFANGTVSSSIWSFNFTDGNLGGWIIIPSSLGTGDTFFDNFSKTSKNITIQSQEQKTVLGAPRTVNYANDTYRHKEWDKNTGVFVGSSEIFRNWSANVNIVATNLWSPQILGLSQTVFYSLVAESLTLAVLAVVSVFVVARRSRVKMGVKFV